MTRTLFVLLAALGLLACSDPAPDDAADAGIDGSLAPDDAGAADGGVDAGVDAPVDAAIDAGPPWPHERRVLGELPALRGMHLARAIVHLHSPLSHDACDGEGWADGGLVAPECLEHLRDGVCRLHLDAVWLTDHAPHFDEVDFERALWIADGDEAIRDDDGHLVAARWACPDGHDVLVSVGSENAMMPLGLERHPADDPAERSRLYEGDGAEFSAAYREAGALVWYAHGESKTADQLRASQPDGMEIYNTHANVAPDIREEFLGLDGTSFLATLLRFTRDRKLEPDLALLSFLSESEPALDLWDTLLAEGMHLVGTGGCDAHENTFKQLMPDGERGDSYRRMMVWHTEHLLVRGDDRAAYTEALGSGRSYLTFEVFGTPLGFDFHASSASDEITEMGGEVAVGSSLHVARPTLSDDFPSDPAPTLRVRLLRAAAGGAIEVASSDTGDVDFVVTEPGAYRAEVRMVPNHARPYLGALADELLREVPWIYSNSIYVAE